VTLSLKGANSPTRGRKLRSTGTKARTHVDRVRESNAELKKKLAEALEQQAATSEVLGVISRSPGELERVFQAMLENATRICGAKFGILFRYEGGVFHPAAMANVPPAFADFLDQQGSFAPVRGQLFGRLAQTREVIHVIDRATEPTPSPSVRYGGARSSIGVPLLKGKELLRRGPRGPLRMTRGRCGSLLLHRKGLAPSTPCRSPGASQMFPVCPDSTLRSRHFVDEFAPPLERVFQDFCGQC
jgi:GAF domain